MRETNGQKQPERRRKPARGGADLGAVRVFFNPGPDAEERLRRVVSLMIRYATQEGRSVQEQHSPMDDRPDHDSTEAEA